MTEPSVIQRTPRALFELLIAFLALHGAFNIGLRTEVGWTAKVFAVIGGVTLLVTAVAHRLTTRHR